MAVIVIYNHQKSYLYQFFTARQFGILPGWVARTPDNTLVFCG
jgi:hypothetical protein